MNATMKRYECDGERHEVGNGENAGEKEVLSAVPSQETGTSASVVVGLLPPSLQPSLRH
jgi:hypothetical protein